MRTVCGCHAYPLGSYRRTQVFYAHADENHGSVILEHGDWGVWL